MRIFSGRNRAKKMAIVLLMVMMVDVFVPSIGWALTSGPSQPEVQSFEPAGTTQMVDLFSGNFTYNIPLFELPGPNGGYPFNLAYHAGIGMDQEASWVGLGWSLNPGAVNRQMRGLPDEFKGDEIETKMSMKPSRTIGTGAGLGIEIFGGLSGGSNLSLFYNNYKGAGIEIGSSLSYGKAIGSGFTAGLNLGFSVNSQEGVGINPSLSLSKTLKEHNGNFSTSGSVFVGAGYNSKVGLTGITTGASVSLIETRARINIETDEIEIDSKTRGSQSYSSTLSLYNPGFTPTVGMPMINSSINLSFEPGGAWWGAFPNMTFSGFYNEQKLKHNKKLVKTPAYGYLHYQDAEEMNALMDFNREKDGVVREENPNLPIPSLTYDIYSATGQGFSAMYRAMRSDVGIIHDPFESSESKGLSLGGDVGPALSHIGYNGTINHAVSQSGKWEINNDVNELYRFQTKAKNQVYEPVFFKAHGESTVFSKQTMDMIGGEDAVMLQLGGLKSSVKATNTLVKGKHSNWSGSVVDKTSFNSERTPRNSVISQFTNDQLKKSNGEEVIDLFKTNYINKLGTEDIFKRNKPGHHIAGFISLTPEGHRYVYALPAYNLHNEEVSYSSEVVTDNTKVDVNPSNSDGEPNYTVEGTNEYLDKKVIPPYAHSYLLTAIVGQDYVDVTGDGVTEDDLGYWVKFTYQQTADSETPYNWRTPFYKANYFSGFKTSKEDDRATYLYGEKELWYLSKVESKSHIAEFVTSKRKDGRGAKYKLQNSDGLDAYQYQLDEIVLYTRIAGSTDPLKKVKFKYENSLCKGIPNAPADEGKLTLKELSFEYGSSRRGSLNPYKFDYHEDYPLENPDYNMEVYDRWGNYKPSDDNDLLQNQEYPYVDQSDPKELHDLRAGVWSLKEIDLPSGGHMIIDYESDDYAYVQNRTAMQMLELVDPASKTPIDFLLDESEPRICFKLPLPISADEVTDPIQAAMPFFESDRDMIYLKLKINLRKPEEDLFDFLTTYVNIDKGNPPYLEMGPSGNYEYGIINLEKEMGFHPISLRAWQHLRVNQPDLANPEKKPDLSGEENGLVSVVQELASLIPEIKKTFTGFYNYARNRDWGTELNGGKCWVRVNVPNKQKFGGGHRVKQVTYLDNWQGDNEGIYGLVYDYSVVEDGLNISSGVAANEPLIGGDENPIRYAKKFSQSIPLLSNNTLFFEYPINEGYYPGPSVGYSQVTVKSLASAAAAGESVLHIDREPGKPIFPSLQEGRYGTTGKVVHEFYTARDFPVIADETMKNDIPDNVWIPALPLGTISAKRLASSQGYSVITNDMHGKMKGQSNYGQSSNGEFLTEPFSWTRYHYMQENGRIIENREASALFNIFKDNNDGTLSKATDSDLIGDQSGLFHMGQEVELIADMRLSTDISYHGGASGNVDMVLIPIVFIPALVPIPSLWPSVGKDEKLLKTAVINKVIFKSGILESIEVFNDGSLVKTRNIKWDKLTGRPILKVVDNNYDEPIYSLEVPAHAAYEGLGPAFENSGYTFDIIDISAVEGRDNYYEVILNYTTRKTLYEGDEIILFGTDDLAKGKAVYLGKEGSRYHFFSKDIFPEDSYSGLVYRSGKRNLLSANAGSITALKDPTQSSGSKTYPVEILSE